MIEDFLASPQNDAAYAADAEADRIRHRTIKAVTNDVEAFHFNTAVARLMEFCTAILKYQTGSRNTAFERSLIEDFIKMIGIFAPHYGEELWAAMGGAYSLFNQAWPQYDEAKLVMSQFELAVQVCGKIKDKLNVPSDASEDEIKAAALALDKVKAAIGDKPVKKVIVIKNRLVNIVV